MKTTIDMAREVKATAYTNRHYPDRTTYTFGPEQLQRFEALVRADERNKQGEAFQQILSSVKACAIADEREACAKVCEELAEKEWADNERCAAAIRARGNT
jgi:hypothetical protein